VARIEELYRSLIFPTPTLILAGQVNVGHIFDASVEGRVTPVGEFHDPEGVNEYFFGLAYASRRSGRPASSRSTSEPASSRSTWRS